MNRHQLESIVAKLPNLKIAVFGDFFLDRYFVIDATLAEVSVETGLPAHQVVERRLSPGAAGTVVSNLRALGVGSVPCFGAIGIDGEGFELKSGLAKMGADGSPLIEDAGRFTPCYTKPMLRERGVEREINRIDIKNRTPLPSNLEDRLLGQLAGMLPELDAVIIADQVQERNFGVVTDRVRHAICELAAKHPRAVFVADSRVRIGEYANVMIKPNRAEAVDAVEGGARADHAGSRATEVTTQNAIRCARILRERTGKPVFLTAGEEGVYVVDDEVAHVAAPPADGELDPVGAGDSCISGIVSGLCAGATPQDAAFLGNLVASITVRKIGQTGTASPAEALAAFDAAPS